MAFDLQNRLPQLGVVQLLGVLFDGWEALMQAPDLGFDSSLNCTISEYDFQSLEVSVKLLKLLKVGGQVYLFLNLDELLARVVYIFQTTPKLRRLRRFGRDR